MIYLPYLLLASCLLPPQEAHPVRLKKIYVVHAAAFINQVMAILKPLIKSELLGLLQFTSKGPKDLFPLSLLPEVSDYRLAFFPFYSHI